MPTSRKSPHSHGRSEVWTRKDLAPAINRTLKRLGTRLRKLRVEQGLSQEEAADLIGLHSKSLPRIEGGTANPTVATLVAASVAYKVPLSALLAETDGEDTSK
ncbi:helix-turn-helix domain-containing protein [Corallococcus macrosporus]|uniref:helix-turn-helix domain-containing protein n=1 Tax=Corallococcus macrosporus TaxID=35 RepID=UPI003B833D33